MESMVDAGVQLGFPRDTAVKLVQSTFYGASAYTVMSPNHLAEDRNAVTSPGGVTAAALYVLERGGLRTTMTDAVFAAHKKSVQLSRYKFFFSSFFFFFFIKKRGSPREDTGGWCSSTLHLIRGVGEPHLCPSLSLKVAPSYPIDADVRIYDDVITFLRPGALPDTMSSGMPDDSF